jgi:hypothetical protein
VSRGALTILTLLACDVIGAQVERLTDSGVTTEYIPRVRRAEKRQPETAIQAARYLGGRDLSG